MHLPTKVGQPIPRSSVWIGNMDSTNSRGEGKNTVAKIFLKAVRDLDGTFLFLSSHKNV